MKLTIFWKNHKNKMKEVKIKTIQSLYKYIFLLLISTFYHSIFDEESFNLNRSETLLEQTQKNSSERLCRSTSNSNKSIIRIDTSSTFILRLQKPFSLTVHPFYLSFFFHHLPVDAYAN